MNIPAAPLHPAVQDAFGEDARFVVPRGARVILASPLGRKVYFIINNRSDRIHKNQFQGRFYEQDLLQLMARHLPENGVFVDIGANIGNHSLFMATHGGASRVVPMEPNPKAISLLVAAMRLNGLEGTIAFETLGYGIGDRNVGGFAIDDPKGNLGRARLADTGGDIELRTGDTLLAQACNYRIEQDLSKSRMNQNLLLVPEAT